MHLIDVSNSYSRKIQRELAQSSTHFIKIYTLGRTRIVYKKSPSKEEIVLSNKIRQVTNEEIDFTLTKLTNLTRKDVEITKTKDLVEIIINDGAD
ncbi:hypothetical protein JCM15457_2280 [Liquorilactobacillus sucicola DSM 21376 = JCM 15457]|uniref:DUF1827 family protein n=1 Tax=Liquorilactobacillus sucicola DSM 21376 = JCM 15457 TaxID=1423806 RepID=A0A023CZS9_9LACO|nr:DUF1827 family protein [Liquorilactobacillus sucicola]KRN05826.1 hypothetical protein FD15_GL001634 [Liquorilactobacillus sucicola DSM 21376 = JCM 15457]GAJ27304.1 hypothetical protein JCM15457_2280 [Liquorilactobacillus sucicola DSM 21376 = JCM 15457]